MSEDLVGPRELAEAASMHPLWFRWEDVVAWARDAGHRVVPFGARVSTGGDGWKLTTAVLGDARVLAVEWRLAGAPGLDERRTRVRKR